MILLQAEIDGEMVDFVNKIKQFQHDSPLATLFPSAQEAVRASAASIQSQWKSYASGEALPSGDRVKRPTGGYAASINMREESPWSYVISSKAAVARWMEDGTPELDMKQTHPYGDRGRVAKKKMPGGGFRYVPYVIVPFRWATPNTGAHMGIKNVIPEQIYAKIQAGMKKGTFARSVVLNGKTQSPNFWGESQERNTYSWGSRLKGLGGNIEGMVAMEGLTKRNGKRESTYFTFRVISADSSADKWIKPATKALKIAEQTAQFMSDKVNRDISDALLLDLKEMKT